MKIKRINLWHQPLSSHTDYHMAAGKSCTTVETVVVRIDSDTGLSGWGEVCPIPHYLPAYARGVAPAIAEMAPELIGAEFSAPEALLARLDRWLLGHAYAKSALDIALWDLLGRALGQPVHKLLGGKRNQRLPLYHSVTCIAPKAMLAIAEEAYAEWYSPNPSQARRRWRLAQRCQALNNHPPSPTRRRIGLRRLERRCHHARRY